MKNIKALKAAFPHTIPVLTGYLFLGLAYGILMKVSGFSAGITAFASIAVYAGSLQYVGINFLLADFNPLYVFMMSVIINARHLFYGISMLDRYRNTGTAKPYLIFGLTDETFSVLCSQEPPQDVDRKDFFFWITLLNHFYWVASGLLGNLAGSFISINTKGIDFVLTALFVVIFINQWMDGKGRIPAVVGLLLSLFCLIIFGPDRFIIPAMLLILISLIVYGNINNKEQERHDRS